MSSYDHPSHYNIHGRRECLVEMEEDYGVLTAVMYCLTSAYKYEYRAGVKDGETAEDDLSKAKWLVEYAEKLIVDKDVFGCDVQKLLHDVKAGLPDG